MIKPSRSPARRARGLRRRTASAWGMVETGMMPVAPFPSAVTMLVVARKTSNTTHVVSRKSRALNASNSAGDKRTSNVIEELFQQEPERGCEQAGFNNEC